MQVEYKFIPVSAGIIYPNFYFFVKLGMICYISILSWEKLYGR